MDAPLFHALPWGVFLMLVIPPLLKYLLPFPGCLTLCTLMGGPLTSRCSKPGLQTSSVSWVLIQNAKSQAYSRPSHSESAF